MTPSSDPPNLLRRIAIVEDDPVSSSLLVQLVRKSGFTGIPFASCREVEVAIAEPDQACPWDMMVVDLGLPDGDGQGLLEQVKRRFPQLPCIVLTARDRAEDAVRALKNGAVDYVVKPYDPERFFALVRKVAESHEPDVEELLDEGYAWRSPAMLRVRELFRQAAGSHRPVLIEGEPGVGKRRLAARLHELSGSTVAGWLDVDCAVMPPQEFMARVFGGEYVNRAGAALSAKGLLNARQPSTLVLRHVEALPADCQRHLTEALGNGYATGPCRVVTISSRPVQELLGVAELDPDLVYRLSVLHLPVPALRERRVDLVKYWEFVLSGHSVKHRLRCPRLDRSAREWIADHPWPGNLHEVRASVEEVMADSQGGEISARQLTAKQRTWSRQLGDASTERDRNRMHELEREALIQALRAVGGNRRRAAKALGVSLRTIYNMLDRHELRELKF
ncbi:sigma-54-dependent transcriptional regulator [Haloferula sargassicola]